MAVMTHARIQTSTATYSALTPTQQATFDTSMELADSTVDAAFYNRLMALAADAAGIDIPAGGEIAKCACPHNCGCAAVFDTALPGLTVVETSSYGLPILQCADCTDEHPAPAED